LSLSEEKLFFFLSVIIKINFYLTENTQNKKVFNGVRELVIGEGKMQ